MELSKFLTNEQYSNYISSIANGIVQRLISERCNPIGQGDYYDDVLCSFAEEVRFNHDIIIGDIGFHMDYILEKFKTWRVCDIGALERIEKITM